MHIHLFPHGVGNRQISSHEGVSNPFRGSVRIQLPMRTVWVLNGLQPWVGVEWWEEERGRGGEEVTYTHFCLIECTCICGVLA